MLILLLGGIALPGAAVYINHARLRGKSWESAVSAAGPFMSFLVAVLLAVPFQLQLYHSNLPTYIWPALAALCLLQAVSVILNLLPFPGLDGYGVIEPWLPVSLRLTLARFSRHGMLVLFAILWFVPGPNRWIWTMAANILSALHVPRELAYVGFESFQHDSGWMVIALIAVLFVMRGRGKKEPTPTATDFYEGARKLFNAKQYADALLLAHQAEQLQPNFAEAIYLQGLCCAVSGKTGDAMQLFDRALQIKPNYADCWYNRACCLALAGDREQALSNLAHAIQLSPTEIKQHAKQDVGFKSLWNDEHFQQLTQQ